MAAKQKRRSKRGKKEIKPILFSSENYKMMGLGVILVIIGFTAMYIENEVHGIISLYISPIVIIAGYITIIFAILKRDNEETKPQRSAQ